MRRVVAGSAAALLVMMGPLGLLWAASPAGAMPTSPAAHGRSQGAAPLGGFSLSATGDGLRLTYEQPNLPLPANPSAEGDVGYSSATFGSGPVGQSTASVLYPGPVLAAAGSQLGAIIPGAPALPNWPVQAHASYPTGSGTAKDDQGPMTMEARSAAGGSSATSGMGTPSTAGIPAGLLTAQTVASTSSTTVPAGMATATSTASTHDLKIAGGVIEITSAKSTATERSDGYRATCSATSTISGVTVAGQAVTVDASGVHAAGHDLPIGLLGLTPAQVLQMAGLSMSVTTAKHTTNGAAGSCSASSLEIQLDLTKFDSDAAQLVVALPSQIASVIYQLPLPVPDSQVMTLYVGEVSASAAAAPAYVPPPLPPPKPPTGGTPLPRPPTPSGPSAPSGTPVTLPNVTGPATSPASNLTSPATSGPTGSGAPAAGGSSPSAQGVPAFSSKPAAVLGPTVPADFKGLGALPVGLGLAGATGLALAVTRMDRKLLAGARRMVCAVRPTGGAAAAAASTAAPPAGTNGPWPVGRAAPVAAPKPGPPSAKGARF